jgi:hypothetical protein
VPSAWTWSPAFLARSARVRVEGHDVACAHL